MRKSSFNSRWLLVFLFIHLILSFAIADGKTDQVDKIFVPWDSTASPGAALAIIKDGKIIYKRGYGMANLEHNIPITPTAVFRIGSTSKQFTAASIAILAREGTISLDDDIRKYIPEMPKHEKPITVRHLVHHTSGIRNYTSLLPLAGYRTAADCRTVEETIEILARQKRLNFSPGEEYSYSNSGYFLLSVIVERASGKSLNDFAHERIFKPLGMKNTHFHDDHTMIVKNRADGYSPTKKGFCINMSNWNHVGDGAIFTTVEDLFLWDHAFYNNKLGKKLMELIQTPARLWEYAGEYYSDELLTTYRLVVEEEALVFKQRNAPKYPLKALARDKFIIGRMNIEFLRNRRKKITGFNLGVGRINLEFIRK